MSFISIKQNPETATKQSQNLLVSMAMQQAFHVLQLPALELSEWLKQEIEQNPVLELDLSENEQKENLDDLCSLEYDCGTLYESSDPTTLELEKKRKAYQESLLVYPTSLYEHLYSQARLTFEDPSDLSLAEEIIGGLDAKGFLSAPLSETGSGQDPLRIRHVLSVLQTFDPPGVCAQNLQESLLIQLSQAKKTGSIAFLIIQDHFDDLLANKLPQIARKLGLLPEQVQKAIETDISVLSLHPGYAFENSYTSTIVPDIHLEQHEGHWEIKINQSRFPHFRISPAYEKSLMNPSLPKDEERFFHKHIASGNWLKKIVKRREDTLLAISQHLIKKQSAFLGGEQKTLVPMNIQEIAEQIGMHESTVARAISNKYLSCPQGIFSLRSFFTQGLICQNGQKVSNHTLRQLLSQMIDREDKAKPLADEEIVRQFKKMGIPCARRTVAKYRQKLRIAPAAKRRKWLQTSTR
ncbi:MAG: RNA polymerase factor sigma-54 [Verrucomicrobia bacterium]|nr:RNA polymerase factor sigma-54 [Verrucomicrobiota bacterium]